VSREELPKALATWYDYTKWVLDRVDGFPKNQRFVLGTRLADAVVDVMELLAEAAYAGKVRQKCPTMPWSAHATRASLRADVGLTVGSSFSPPPGQQSVGQPAIYAVWLSI
jgi:hypothetical protein